MSGAGAVHRRRQPTVLVGHALLVPCEQQVYESPRQRQAAAADSSYRQPEHAMVQVRHDIPEVLRNKRMGHKSGKMSQHYAHVTADMEERLMKALTPRWEESLATMGVEDWRELWTPEALPGYRKAA